MSLRGRLTLMSALIVGVILAAGAVVCFVVMRHQLRSQVDDQLVGQARLVQRVAPRAASFPRQLPALPRGAPQRNAPYSQLIGPSGQVLRPDGADAPLPVTPADLAVARGGAADLRQDRTVDGQHLRVVTVHIRGRGAIQLGRPLAAVDSTLASLRIVLALLVVGGLALAALAGRLFFRPVLAPIEALTEATEHIEATGDLGRRVNAERTDEVGRLATSFNAMLERVQHTQAALSESMTAQRQLVADASHELRTPVASLRTNIEVLLAGGAIDPDERNALMADVVEQTEELSAIVSDLIELARGDLPASDEEDLDLAAIATLRTCATPPTSRRGR
jgi:two-component system sensor histidine kinase MprB